MEARVLAPLVAALVGIAAGTSTALVTADASGGDRDDEQTVVKCVCVLDESAAPCSVRA